jgi:hypothetical protein
MNSKCFIGLAWLLLAALAALGQVSNTVPTSGDVGPNLGRQIFDELVATQIHRLVWASAKWAILGGFVGLLVAVAMIIGARAAGWYRSGWKHAKWFRWSLWILTVPVCIALIGVAGFWKGVIQGSEQVLMESQLATKVFPRAGDAMADVAAFIQVYLSDTNDASRSETNLTAKIEAFRSGAWEVDAPAFLQQLERAHGDFITNAVVETEQDLIASVPYLQSGLANKVVHRCFDQFGAALVRMSLNSQAKRLGTDGYYQALGDRLVADARKQSPSETISRPELSAFFVREAMVPGIMKPIRILSGEQAKLFFWLGIIAGAVPAVFFRFTFGLIKAPAVPTASAPSIQRQEACRGNVREDTAA